MNPALMTFDEYYKIVNANEKFHSDTAYDASLEDFKKSEYLNKSNFEKLLKRVKIRGIMFEFRLHARPVQYVHKNEAGEYRRDAEKNLIYMSPEEIKQAKLKTHEITIAVFNDEDECVGAVQDEWGTVLVRVAKEYRGFGLGVMLTKIARSMEPEKSSGGFTHSGYKNFVKTYQEFVRDALSSGLYTSLVKKNEISADRAKEIIASAKLKDRIKSTKLDVNTNDPADWLLYVGGYGDFILYDRKLKDIYQDTSYHYWIEKMIKGATLVREHPDGNALIVQFHGATDQIKKFLMSCVLSYCFNEKMALYVEPEDISYVDSRLGDAKKQPDMTSGHRRYFVKPKAAIAYEPMGRAEKSFRKSFDQYDEFKNTVLEVAFSN